MDPIKFIDENASKINEEDVEWLVEDLMEHFSGRMHSLSTYVYGSERGVALDAFKEWSRKTLDRGVRTFLFKNEHWRQARSIGPYLAKALTKLGDSLKHDVDFVKRVSTPICPACRTLNQKEFLVYEGKLLRCASCTREHIRLEEKSRTIREEYEYRIRKVFSLHSRKGRRCPSCERFIPESYINAQKTSRVSCPYDNCAWFGIESELEPMTHPLGQSTGMTVSINTPISDGWGSGDTEMGDLIDAQEINPDIRIEQSEKYQKELAIAQDVIKTQKSRLLREPMKKVIKRYLMYEAFESLLNSDPEGMIAYLIHGKALGERPIQSLIFQKYIRLLENKLPFSIYSEDGETEVYSLLDPTLNLFLGTSEFQALVRESGLVPNNTHEIFTGAKCKGPCFIGLLCDVMDTDGNSLLSDVEYYTFSSIKMKATVPENTLVNVVHFRIPPHYEMYSLVNLQRTRKHIVSSIRRRLRTITERISEICPR